MLAGPAGLRSGPRWLSSVLLLQVFLVFLVTGAAADESASCFQPNASLYTVVQSQELRLRLWPLDSPPADCIPLPEVLTVTVNGSSGGKLIFTRALAYQLNVGAYQEVHLPIREEGEVQEFANSDSFTYTLEGERLGAEFSVTAGVGSVYTEMYDVSSCWSESRVEYSLLESRHLCIVVKPVQCDFSNRDFENPTAVLILSSGAVTRTRTVQPSTPADGDHNFTWPYHHMGTTSFCIYCSAYLAEERAECQEFVEFGSQYPDARALLTLESRDDSQGSSGAGGVSTSISTTAVDFVNIDYTSCISYFISATYRGRFCLRMVVSDSASGCSAPRTAERTTFSCFVYNADTPALATKSFSFSRNITQLAFVSGGQFFTAQTAEEQAALDWLMLEEASNGKINSKTSISFYDGSGDLITAISQGTAYHEVSCISDLTLHVYSSRLCIQTSRRLAPGCSANSGTSAFSQSGTYVNGAGPSRLTLNIFVNTGESFDDASLSLIGVMERSAVFDPGDTICFDIQHFTVGSHDYSNGIRGFDDCVGYIRSNRDAIVARFYGFREDGKSIGGLMGPRVVIRDSWIIFVVGGVSAVIIVAAGATWAGLSVRKLRVQLASVGWEERGRPEGLGEGSLWVSGIAQPGSGVLER